MTGVVNTDADGVVQTDANGVIQTVTSSSVPSSVTNRWKFGSGSGDATDSIGSISLTNSGVTWAANSDAVGGYDVSFDGSAKFDGGDQTTPPQLSHCFWINFDSISSTSNEYIVDFGNNSSNDDGLAILSTGNVSPDDGEIAVNVGGTLERTTFLPSTGVWYHFGMTYASDGTLTFYVDGQVEYTASVGDGQLTDGSRSLIFGSDAFGGGNGISADMDDHHIANAALTQTEVQDIIALSPRESVITNTYASISTFEDTNEIGDPDPSVSNPIVSISNLSWESSGVREPGNVLYDGGRTPPYVWYFTGQGSQQIGVYESTDGFSWSESRGSPLSQTPREDPYAREVNGTYYLFHERNSDNSITRVSGSSYDAIENNETQVLANGPSGSWDENNAASPLSFEYNGTEYLMYEGLDANNDNGQLGIATASTIDGTFSKSADNPIHANVAGSWFSKYIVPDELVQRNSDGRWFLYVHGSDGSVQQTGVFYTDVNPPNWTDTSDWTEVSANPLNWSTNSGTTDTGMFFEHPDTGELQAMIMESKSEDGRQDRFLR